MNDDRDADLAFMALVLPLVALTLVLFWAAFAWIVTRFGS